MERRLAAILAADVKGYSHLTELNEEASGYSAHVPRHKGHVFSSAGDKSRRCALK